MKTKSEQEVYQQVITYRGTIIHWSIIIEQEVEEILLNHFCEKDTHKRKEFVYGILAKESYGFNGKIECLNLIINNSYPETNKKFPSLKESLSELILIRNHCAHRDYIIKQEPLSLNRTMFAFKYYKTKGGKIGDMPTEVKINLEVIDKFLVNLVNIRNGLAYVRNRVVKNSK